MAELIEQERHRRELSVTETGSIDSRLARQQT
jgi:hypothetical protein